MSCWVSEAAEDGAAGRCLTALILTWMTSLIGWYYLIKILIAQNQSLTFKKDHIDSG